MARVDTVTWRVWLACRTSGSLRFALASSAAILILAGTAAAGTITWSKPDMVAAVKALGYPKPHARKITCRAVGPAFRCTAIYRRKRVFYTEGKAPGGWLCAGSKLATCKMLPRGFLAKDTIPAGLTLDAMVSVSAAGYAENKYNIPSTQRSASCTQAGAMTWTCPFTYPAATITITYKTANSGWIVLGSG